MAILPGFPGIECKIVVNGEPAAECDDNEPTEDPLVHKTCIKYNGASDDAEFESHSLVLPKYTFESEAIVFQIFVDGVSIDGNIREPHNEYAFPPDIVQGHKTFAEGGKHMVSRFKFSGVSIGKLWGPQHPLLYYE